VAAVDLVRHDTKSIVRKAALYVWGQKTILCANHRLHNHLGPFVKWPYWGAGGW
jgi:hypothetical protein